MSQPVSNCPNCGAKIVFRWSSSVQTVCEYCKSILVRTDVDLKKVGHLYRRAAFGATMQELDFALQLGPERAVGQVLQGRPDPEGDEVWGMVTRGIRQFNLGDQLAAALVSGWLAGGRPIGSRVRA